jgi:hypothetical protein
MKRVVRYTLLALGAVLIAIQFVPNDLPLQEDRPPTDLVGTGEVPAAISSILTTSCYDCHSVETKYPWYSHVAPSSWLVAKDITEGRDEMNLSEWGDLTQRKKIKVLENIKDEVLEGHMPLPMYTLIHWDARLSDEQRKQIADWCVQYQDVVLSQPDLEEDEEEEEEEM